MSGSVRELLHIVGAQQTFILRTKDANEELDREEPVAWYRRIHDLAESTSQELIAIAENLTTRMDLPYMGKRYRCRNASSSSHHRPQRRTPHGSQSDSPIGVETPDLDGWFYADFAGYGSVVD